MEKTDCPDAPDARLVPSALPDTGHGKDACFWNTKKMVRRAPPFRAVRKEDDMRAPGCIPEAVRRVLSAVEGQGRTPSL